MNELPPLNDDSKASDNSSELKLELLQPEREKIDTDFLNINKTQSQPNEPVINEPVIDEQWLSLTQDWQSQPYEKTDIKALLKQTKRRILQAKALLLFDTVSTLAIFVAILYGYFFTGWGKTLLIFLGISGLMSIGYVYLAAKIRFASWKVFNENPNNIIQIALEGCQSSIKFIKLVKFTFIFSTPLVNWFVFEMAAQRDKSVWLSFLIANSALLLAYGVTHFYHKKRQAELKQLTSSH
ncbi:hypothetical protein CJF42_10610 [Pseudoalteromonas sp. NBT06-2]|uniref:hypothetical protein n=1 Tax=Pseudoalteromonas sp. NBT06-2 TaxID=2025950 RepID=UPI000BA5CACE|nr:hypothetical protein [Pseudoalteromonas sp. NBT06-2]PAJ74447.1 hypothetical protein CJF42_10610 [Pseudoalteromonas sp. NBT06-2]